MQTEHRSTRGTHPHPLTLTRLATAVLIALGLSIAGTSHPQPAFASVIITIAPSGTDVIASSPGGTIDTTSLTFASNVGPLQAAVGATGGTVRVGSTGFFDFYNTGVSGPTSLGSGAFTAATASAGPIYGLNGGAANQQIFLPTGYTSNGALAAASATFGSSSIASLGLTPGSYVWTWGAGPTADSLTVNVVPEPTTGALLALGLSGLAFRRAAKPRTARQIT